MKTRVNEIFDIEHPIFMSGMSWVSVTDLVASVSNAGGLGILATGVLGTNETRKAIREIREKTDKPFGANATLLFPGAVQNAQVMLEEKVPMINFALGKGDWIAQAAHEYGGKVVATVTNVRHAKRAQEYGCDAVIATGNEAAAHGESPTTFCLVPSISEQLDIPVIAAGGIAEGRGLAAAICLGAEGVAMGTRFMATKESPLHENYKQLSLEKEVYDTLYSKRFDGLWCRVMDTEGARKAIKSGLNPIQMIKAIPNSRSIAKMLSLPYWKLFIGVLTSGWENARQLAYMANAFEHLHEAAEGGDLKDGVLPVGQAQGLMHDIPTVREVIERMVREAEEIFEESAEKMRA
jgi:enoyl-[acyl-carrier protein] reductase II